MESRNISTQIYNECCGCKACGDVCPKKAISFTSDKEGFLYPSISNNCINCGLCRKVCPVLNTVLAGPEVLHSYWGCLDRDEKRRESGSSGGIFGLIAGVLVEECYEICAAAFDEQLRLKHQFASDKDGVEKLKKSKYIQSDCSNIYSQIKDKLTTQGKVMFVGTPCQCNALLNIVGEYRDNLVVVDFACHGVPSQDLFDRCLRLFEKNNDCKVLDYSFRHKPKRYGAPQNFLLSVQKNEGVFQKAGRYYEDPFYCGFQKYITLRPSCYSCKWTNTDRISDITLADFWGIEEITSKWDRTDYPSCVILNTDKGKRLFESIKSQIDSMEVVRENVIRQNSSLVKPTKLSLERNLLFSDIQTLSFEEVVKRHLTIKSRWRKDFYYAIPFAIRKILLNITGKL